MAVLEPSGGLRTDHAWFTIRAVTLDDHASCENFRGACDCGWRGQVFYRRFAGKKGPLRELKPRAEDLAASEACDHSRRARGMDDLDPRAAGQRDAKGP